MKKYLSIILLFIFGLIITSCAMSSKDSAGGYEYYSGDSSYGESSAEYSSKIADSIKLDVEGYEAIYGSIRSSEKIGGLTDEEIVETYGQVASGQLSASAYNDNEHYEFFKTLTQSGQTEEENGEYYEYNKEFKDPFGVLNRIKLTFKNNKLPNKVSIIDNEGNVITQNTPLKSGELYLFTKAQESYKLDIEYTELGEIKHLYDEVTSDKEYELSADVISNNLLELMFVIDTTGSMGDEMMYLSAELTDVIEKVYNSNPDLTIKTSILVYRDTTDDYVTKYSDFTTTLAESVNFLKAQCANGGGDFEEAVEVALQEASEKNWSTDSTKLIIHVADAPAHDEKVTSWNKAVKSIAEKGIRIITVASSGIDSKTQYFFRCQSMVTNGIYTYLTNDSGIGGDHIKTTTEGEVTVEYLNSMLVRLIKGFLTGTFEEPVAYQVENIINDEGNDPKPE